MLLDNCPSSMHHTKDAVRPGKAMRMTNVEVIEVVGSKLKGERHVGRVQKGQYQGLLERFSGSGIAGDDPEASIC